MDPDLDLSPFDGATFCMVFMTVLDELTHEVKLQPFHGRARVLKDRLTVEAEDGDVLAVPDSALTSIRRSDGMEPMLKDATYFVIVKIGTSLPS